MVWKALSLEKGELMNESHSVFYFALLFYLLINLFYHYCYRCCCCCYCCCCLEQDRVSINIQKFLFKNVCLSIRHLFTVTGLMIYQQMCIYYTISLNTHFQPFQYPIFGKIELLYQTAEGKNILNTKICNREIYRQEIS